MCALCLKQLQYITDALQMWRKQLKNQQYKTELKRHNNLLLRKGYVDFYFLLYRLYMEM